MAYDQEEGHAIGARIHAWLERARDDAVLIRAARGLAFRLDLEAAGNTYLLQVAQPPGWSGRLCAVSVRISATSEVWAQVIRPDPPPGFQSFTALRRCESGFTVAGDELEVAQALAALERLFEIAHMSPDTSASHFNEQVFLEGVSSIAGAYRRIECGNSAALLYYDSSGEGVPLVMLHTAGADSRQYLGVLADRSLQNEWQMFAFDMPFHGRSFPVESWHGQAYRLRQSEYVRWCLRFIEEVIGRPAVVMGCSMGASISIALAASGSPWVRAVIALEAPDRSPGRLNPYLDHAAVNQSLHSQAYVRGLMSPTSPQRSRDLACWIYSQGGPGVYAGDLYFYSEEYDGAALAKSIDTRRCPVFLLTGEYDYSASPESTQRLAERIPGAYVQELEGLGHFPMTEDPARFKEALHPVLLRVRKAVGPQS